jgi:hypothetical protein
MCVPFSWGSSGWVAEDGDFCDVIRPSQGVHAAILVCHSRIAGLAIPREGVEVASMESLLGFS